MLLETIKYIDSVYIFNSEDALRGLIKNNDVDTIVVGDDYKHKYVIGSEYSKETLFFTKIL
jgi:glycerol-3-phosphate cytidylyltransferase-like family protein